MSSAAFQKQLLSWFDQHGRKDLPWQKDITPYRVWISETMLQQTQVATVIPYFIRFVERFPDLEVLAQAPVDDVLHFWSGLGYYARARNLHKAARLISERGTFPDTLEELTQLPGIGRSTAGAILSIAFNKSHPILDGNVRRVLARYKAVHGWSGKARVNKELWELSKQLTPLNRVADYTQAIMDLGATLCKRSKPGCGTCPLMSDCQAFIASEVMCYPSAKPAKVSPVKRIVFLILRNDFNQFLLEKRPPAGIWGGLWSLPEFYSIDDALDWCMTHHMPILNQQVMETQRHSFSHYHLDFTPLLIETDNRMNNVMEPNRMLWYKTKQIQDIGLPAPIKLLLQQLGGDIHG
jgi:A/G-specific adenine glycosylase